MNNILGNLSSSFRIALVRSTNKNRPSIIANKKQKT